VAGAAIVPAFAEAPVPAVVVLALLPDDAVVGEPVPAVEVAGRVAVLPAEGATVPVLPATDATWDMPGAWVVPDGGVVVSPLGVEVLLQAAASAMQARPVRKPVRILIVSLRYIATQPAFAILATASVRASRLVGSIARSALCPIAEYRRRPGNKQRATTTTFRVSPERGQER